MLRIYKLGEYTYQFEEGEAPAGAVLVEDDTPNKAAPAKANKARTPRKRTAKKAVTMPDAED